MSDFEGADHYPLDLGALPPGWAPAWVGDLCSSVQSGFASGEHNATGAGIIHLRPMNMSRIGKLDLSEVKYVQPVVDDRRVRTGDVLFNNTNSPALIGKTCVISTDRDMAFSNHMTRLRPRAGVDPRFLAHQLYFLWMNGYFLHRCVKHVNQASVASSVLASTVPLASAPSPEQRRIADAIDSHLSRLDDAVFSLARLRRNLERYRAAVLKAAVAGRLVPPEAELARAEGRDYEPADVLLKRILAERHRRWREAGGRGKYQEPVAPDTTDLPALPEGWCWATVEAVGDVLLGRRRAPEYRGQLRPYLRVANIRDDRIDLDHIKHMPFDESHAEHYLLRAGDILVSEGQSPELIGQSAIYRGGIDGLCFQSTLHRFCPFVSGPTSEFAQLVFRSHVRSGVFQRYASITTNIAHLVLNRFKAVPFPLPPRSEQERIVQAAGDLLSLAESVDDTSNHGIARCRLLRQSILKWAFEGKLVDQDPSDEPADMLLDRIRKGAATGQPGGGRVLTKRRRDRSGAKAGLSSPDEEGVTR